MPRCFRERCRRSATHDIVFADQVQIRGDDGAPRWHRKTGDPILREGVLRVVRGRYGCEQHIGRWADDLNERRLRRLEKEGHPAPSG